MKYSCILIMLIGTLLCFSCSNPSITSGSNFETITDYGSGDNLAASSFFITEWNIPVANTIITLPLGFKRTTVYEDVYFDFIVDWGDGSSPEHISDSTNPAKSHEYAVAGVYLVKISGICDAWDFGEIPDSREYVTAVRSWGADPEFSGFKRLSFEGCNNLQSLATGGIKGNAWSFYQSFYKCEKLATIPEDLFKYSTGATEFVTVFSRTAITKIPPGLFRYTVAVRDFSIAFEYCSQLTSIPEELFSNTPQVKNMQRVFSNCTALVSIPADLFKSVPEVLDFGTAFAACTSLTELPQDLFRNNSKVESFLGVFRECTELKRLPLNLFRYNTAVSDFSNAFHYCPKLETIPAELFRYNTSAENFDWCFKDCYSLIMRPDIFYVDGEQSRRFAGKTVSFEDFFYRDAFSASSGTAPDLWDCSGSLVGNNCFGGDGNISTLDNYDDIPDAWKN